jgi:hypothetical protein
MNQAVRVAKIGKSAESTDPNDFIFHSSYNTFKIIVESTKDVTLSASTNNQTFSEAHGQEFIPLMAAFALESGRDQVFLPNSYNCTGYGVKAGLFSSGVTFNYVSADSANINFNFDNTNGTTKDISIRYFLLEQI